GVDGAERELAALRARPRTGHVVEQPGNLGAAEVGIDHQAGALAHQALGAHLLQLRALRRGAPVLPDDGVMDRLAGLPVPEDRGLALVGDADAHHILERDLGPAQHFARGVALRLVDLLRVVLDPAGLRENLAELALRGVHPLAVLVEQDGARAGGSLVESEDVAHRAILLPLESAPYGIAGHRGRARAAPHAARALRGLPARRRVVGSRRPP